jgi:polysaccharide export outer membrane protein
MTLGQIGACGALFLMVAAANSNVAGAQAPAPAPAAQAVQGVPLPEGYVIGPEDVLSIRFWRDDQMSADAIVRPDGKITLNLLNDIEASGLTPPQLREVLAKAATKFLEDPTVTVIVKQINSRKVMVIGEVAKQGPQPLNGPLTVLGAIGQAGGFTDYADKEKILIIRTEGGKQVPRRFNYKEVVEGRKLEQNIFLMPGDIVTVP